MEVRISYETLFDIVRREKGREELQELGGTFLQDVAAYLAEKEAILSKPAFSKEHENLSTQVHNIKKIIKELFERRENKIIRLAQDRVRMPQGIMMTSALLPHEKSFFDGIITVLSEHHMQLNQSLAYPNRKVHEIDKGSPVHGSAIITTQEVRFLSKIPRFIGKELEVYGPYEQDAIARLPATIAEVLIKKGRAVAIQALIVSDDNAQKPF